MVPDELDHLTYPFRECRQIAPVIPAEAGIHWFPYVKHSAALGHSGFRLPPE